MRRGTTSMLALALCLTATAACRSKAPATSAAAQPAAPTTAATDPGLPQGSTTPADPLAGDLASVNEYIQREGLLGTVFFAYDSSELSPEARDRLVRNARFLRERPELVVSIEGHADERGTNEYNLALGERRAGAARELLESLGVAAERLRPVSYGEERPQCSEPAESCWARNRRVEFVVVGRTHAG